MAGGEAHTFTVWTADRSRQTTLQLPVAGGHCSVQDALDIACEELSVGGSRLVLEADGTEVDEDDVLMELIEQSKSDLVLLTHQQMWTPRISDREKLKKGSQGSLGSPGSAGSGSRRSVVGSRKETLNFHENKSIKTQHERPEQQQLSSGNVNVDGASWQLDVTKHEKEKLNIFRSGLELYRRAKARKSLRRRMCRLTCFAISTGSLVALILYWYRKYDTIEVVTKYLNGQLLL